MRYLAIVVLISGCAHRFHRSLDTAGPLAVGQMPAIHLVNAEADWPHGSSADTATVDRPVTAGAWLDHEFAPLNEELSAEAALRSVRRDLLRLGGPASAAVASLEDGWLPHALTRGPHPRDVARESAPELVEAWPEIARRLGSPSESETRAALADLELSLQSLVETSDALESDIDASELERLLGRLGNRSVGARRRALAVTRLATELIDGYDERCRVRVTANVFDDDPVVLEQAAEWLYLFRTNANSRERIAAHLVDDEAERVRTHGLFVAGDLPREALASPKWMARLVRALDDARETNVVQAITLLGRVPRPIRDEYGMQSRTAAFLESESLRIRSEAHAHLLDEDELRRRLIELSADYDGRLAVDLMLEQLQLEHAHVVENVRLVNDLRAMRRLIPGGGTTNTTLRLLDRVDERMFLPENILLELFEIGRSELRIAVLETAGRRKSSDETVRQLVLAAILEEDTLVWRAGHDLLESRPDVRSSVSAELLVSAVSSPDASTRSRCEDEALATPVDVDVAERALEPFTESEDGMVRLRAWTLLSRITLDDERLLSEFRRALDDDDPHARRYAVRRLGQSGRSAVPAFAAVLSLVNDDDPGVSAAAVDAVQRIQPHLPGE